MNVNKPTKIDKRQLRLDDKLSGVIYWVNEVGFTKYQMAEDGKLTEIVEERDYNKDIYEFLAFMSMKKRNVIGFISPLCIEGAENYGISSPRTYFDQGESARYFYKYT